jgi:hypothetical protein
VLDRLLITCFVVSLITLVATTLLLFFPVSRSELRLWRLLRARSLRHWISTRRRVNEPLDPHLTPALAQRNLLWHLVLNALFSGQIAGALFSTQTIWRPLAPVLVLPCLAYLAGSVVQRQKIAIVRSHQLGGARSAEAHPRQAANKAP